MSEAGLVGQQRKLEVIANNLANVDTPGFKRVLTTFEATPPAVGPNFPVPGGPTVQPQAAARNPANQNVLWPGSLLRLESAVDLRPGSARATGNPLDLAIDGDGFFTVSTPRGERFTRNGSFTLDPEGRLTTRDGWAVLGEGGPIEIPPGVPVSIASDGTVRAGDAEVGRLKVVAPRSRDDLVLDGDTMLAVAPGAAAPSALAPERTRVHAGYLEGSNTNPVSELVAMITAQRIFEAGQRVLSAADETLKKAVNELPRVG